MTSKENKNKSESVVAYEEFVQDAIFVLFSVLFDKKEVKEQIEEKRINELNQRNDKVVAKLEKILNRFSIIKTMRIIAGHYYTGHCY